MTRIYLKGYKYSFIACDSCLSLPYQSRSLKLYTNREEEWNRNERQVRYAKNNF